MTIDQTARLEKLRVIVAKKLAKSQRGSVLWSMAHHCSIWGASVLSCIAGYFQTANISLLYLGSWGISSAVLTFSAASLAAIAAVGNFQEKWKTNRSTRTNLELLLLDFEREIPDYDAIADTLKQILISHDRGIVHGVGSNSNAAGSKRAADAEILTQT